MVRIIATAAAIVAYASAYTVHKDCAEHARDAAWARTKCGSYTTNPPSTDIITKWGATVTPVDLLQEYPRPQMTRGAATYKNVNGLWEFQLAAGHRDSNQAGVFDDAVPFGMTLNQTILVPFPLESCLSGAFRWPEYSQFMFYRLLFDAPFASGITLLHFGAVDWNATVYINGKAQGTHLGGYDGFGFDVTADLQATNNELIVAVYDPSDEGYQVEGKQRISAIHSPGGDTYTPSSGIWQTVWMENVPTYHIRKLSVRGDMQNIYLTVETAAGAGAGSVSGSVSFGGVTVAAIAGATGAPIVIPIASPKLWGPLQGNLYDLTITATETATGAADTVGSYVGMRSVGKLNFTVPPQPPTGPRVGWDNSGGDMPGQPTVLPAANYNLCWAKCNETAGCAAWSYGVQGAGCETQPLCWLKATVEGWGRNDCRVAGDMGTAGGLAVRPAINGEFAFLAGWLDQGWWPDGEYTAPSDAALASDLQAVVNFGLNTVRMHQKVNSQRWYYWADTLGVVLFQDMIQKYGGASARTVPDFEAEIKAMIDGVGSHPCIVQWTVFNEGDDGAVFNITNMTEWVVAYDPHRLVDTNSGGPGNDLRIADVNDIHSYPWPGSPSPSATQYAMVGEFGGIGAFIPGSEWAAGQCSTYLKADSPQQEADYYVQMAGNLSIYRDAPGVSACIYTQITDVENECDGFLTMSRDNKFNAQQMAAVVAANTALRSGQ